MNKRADIPGWAQILGLVLAILLLVFLIWLAVRSGQAGREVIQLVP